MSYLKLGGKNVDSLLENEKGVLIEICHFFKYFFCPPCNVVLNFRNLALVPYYYWHDVFSGETTSAATTVFLNEYSRFVIGTAKQKLNSCGC